MLRREPWANCLRYLTRTNFTFWQSYKKLTRAVSQTPPLRIGMDLAVLDSDKAETFARAFSAVRSGVARLQSPFAVVVDDCIRQVDSDPDPYPGDEFPVLLDSMNTTVNRLRDKKAP